MAIKHILLLGDPLLRTKYKPVKEFNTPELHQLAEDLRDTLYDFRSRSGFGRGIAAPQIGGKDRMVFIHVDQPIVMVNPQITSRSKSMMTIQDDCFSLPGLLANVKRHRTVTVAYQDLDGIPHTLDASGGMSELLQHEIDHLEGVLMIDRIKSVRDLSCRPIGRSLLT